MGKFFNTYWPFGVSCIAFFMLGAYASGQAHGYQDIPTYKFILNGFFGILFLSKGVSKVKEL